VKDRRNKKRGEADNEPMEQVTLTDNKSLYYCGEQDKDVNYPFSVTVLSFVIILSFGSARWPHG